MQLLPPQRASSQDPTLLSMPILWAGMFEVLEQSWIPQLLTGLAKHGLLWKVYRAAIIRRHTSVTVLPSRE